MNRTPGFRYRQAAESDAPAVIWAGCALTLLPEQGKRQTIIPSH